MNLVGNLTCEHIDYKPVIPAIMANFTLLLCLKNGLQNPSFHCKTHRHGDCTFTINYEIVWRALKKF